MPDYFVTISVGRAVSAAALASELSHVAELVARNKGCGDVTMGAVEGTWTLSTGRLAKEKAEQALHG
jgi:hypothetical protein